MKKDFSRVRKLSSILLVPLLLFFLPTPSAQAAARLQMPPNYLSANSGLVGYWTFDGKDTNWGTNKTNDVSGQGNTGTMTNMSTTTSPVAGKIGQGLSFDGINDHVSMGDVLDFERTQSFSISAWYKLEVISPTDVHIIVSKQKSSGNFEGYSLMVRGDQVGDPLRFALLNSGVSRILTEFPRPNDTAWHHVVMTYDGSSVASGVNMYVDGVSKTRTTVDDTLSDTTLTDRPLNIGAYNNAGNRFNGPIDDVRIYNRALSAAEALNLYNVGKAKVSASATKTKVNMSPTTLLTDGLVGYWTFDGATTTWSSATAGITGDSSGNYYTGTLQSMTQSVSPMPGKIGQALWFDGSNNDYISVTDIPASPTSARSWGGWVYLDSNTNSNLKVVLSHYESTHGYNLFTDSSEQFSCGIGSGGTHYFGYASSLSFNTWTHFMCVYDGSIPDIKYYKNGALVNTNVTAPTTLTDPAANLIIGDDDDNANRNWFGRLDDIRIYSRALSASEVLQLYNAGR